MEVDTSRRAPHEVALVGRQRQALLFQGLLVAATDPRRQRRRCVAALRFHKRVVFLVEFAEDALRKNTVGFRSVRIGFSTYVLFD